nr:GNAT family N-acetyltransferase [uncultured Agathobaculum sp.]
MELVIKRFDELTLKELYEILQVRVNVFVVEQCCAYPEIDGKDAFSHHLYYWDADGIQAYLRVVDAGVSFDEVSIGRVLSRKRRCGLASSLLHEGIRFAQDTLGAKAIRIEAQTYARKLYEKAGFRQVSAPFLEDGIPHIQMLLSLSD